MAASSFLSSATMPNPVRACALALMTVLCLLVQLLVNADLNEDTITWAQENGGYFNPKQELRYEGNSTLFGVFAAEDIEENEVLMSMPWKVVISLPNRSIERFDDCSLVKRLKEEMDMGDESFYAPYVKSLMQAAEQHSPSLVPAFWTDEAKQLLLNVLGNGTLPPQDPFLDKWEWVSQCEQYGGKELLSLIMTHGEEFGMSPLTDKYNSRGGYWTGAFQSIYGGKGEVAMEIIALRDIEKGEQIYTDYLEPQESMGTPELFQKYGFVEPYPQRWIFYEQKFAFDLGHDDDGSVNVGWHSRIGDNYYKDRDAETIEFLRRELERLRNTVYPELERMSQAEDCPVVPRAILDLITQYCRALMESMEIAIEEATDYLEEIKATDTTQDL